MKPMKLQTTRWCLLRKNQHSEKGHSTLELTILMLPFLIVLFGVMEFGWYFLHQHTLQHATREGMRFALVGETLLNGQGEPMTREDSIIQTIRDKAGWVMDSNQVQVWIFKVGSNYESPTSWENLAPNAGNPADYMRVKTQYDYPFLVPLIGSFFSEEEAISMWAEATYRNELFEI